MIELAEIGLPQLAAAEDQPRLPAEEYERRMRDLESAVDADVVVVYGDREHVGNLMWACGFDPRFEEAVLILGGGERHLLLGTEGLGYARGMPVEVELVHVPSFSLPGIDLSEGYSLTEALDYCGVKRGQSIGLGGWKSIRRSGAAALGIAAPAFLVDALREKVGAAAVVDVTDVLTNTEGLRTINSADQIAVFEWGSSRASAITRDVVRAARAGATEAEVFGASLYRGEPFSYHPIITSGPDIPIGLRSPTDRVLEAGDAIFATVGMWGGNCGRGGMLATDSGDVAFGNDDYLETVAIPYWRVIAGWYENVAVGACGGEVHGTLVELSNQAGFEMLLTSGHQQDWEDWPNTPMRSGSEDTLRSGMTLAVDVFSAANGPKQMVHCEDTVALADHDLRAELAERHPSTWTRIAQRQAFLRETLGVPVGDDILPLTVMPGYLPPFWLEPDRALRVA